MSSHRSSLVGRARSSVAAAHCSQIPLLKLVSSTGSLRRATSPTQRPVKGLAAVMQVAVALVLVRRPCQGLLEFRRPRTRPRPHDLALLALSHSLPRGALSPLQADPPLVAPSRACRGSAERSSLSSERAAQSSLCRLSHATRFSEAPLRRVLRPCATLPPLPHSPGASPSPQPRRSASTQVRCKVLLTCPTDTLTHFSRPSHSHRHVQVVPRRHADALERHGRSVQVRPARFLAEVA